MCVHDVLECGHGAINHPTGAERKQADKTDQPEINKTDKQVEKHPNYSSDS